MANLTCIYWVHGSGGDLVQQMLVATGNYANNGSSLIDNTGRALPVTDSVLLKKFPVSDSIGWYNRTWTENELDQLESLAKSSNKSYIVGTHSKEQFDTLSKIPNSTRIGVTYDREIFPAVLKLWARKAAESSVGLNQMYQTTHPVISKKFQEKGLYAEFILNEFLKYVRNIPQEIKDQFEINVDLSDLLNQNLNSLSPLLTDHSYKIFASWYQLQDPLYKYRFKNNFHYANCIGYNNKSTVLNSTDIKLSSLDHIMISNYCKSNNFLVPKHRLKTHTEVVKFFDNYTDS